MIKFICDFSEKKFVARRGGRWERLSLDCSLHMVMSTHDHSSYYLKEALRGMLHLAKSFDTRGTWSEFASCMKYVLLSRLRLVKGAH